MEISRVWNGFKSKALTGSALTIILGIWTLLPISAGAATWLTDLPSAQTAAKAENKLVLLDFTGSDWCGWCIRLKNEVFSKPEFDAFADERLVLVEVDFPRRKPQSAEAKRANAALARQFQIQGFPTLIVLDSNGRHIASLGYQPGGPQALIDELNKLSGHKPAGPTAPPARESKISESPPTPLFNGAPMLPPQTFNDVVLKGIAGTKDNRLAMINNQTLAVGESVILKIGGAQVRVKCLEIREHSVLVNVNGTERELQMRGL